MDDGTRELTFVLLLMGVLFVFGVAAVVVFVRVWRRERGARNLSERPASNESDSRGDGRPPV
jgi:hypothetical protein